MKLFILLFFVVYAAGQKGKDKDKGKQKCTSETQFQCINENCIERAEICNGENDCDDWSDEPPILSPEYCPPCHPEKFPCRNRRCIELINVCDGHNDCGDGSDEVPFGDPTWLCPKCTDDECLRSWNQERAKKGQKSAITYSNSSIKL